jgi:CBS domain-containing protein
MKIREIMTAEVAAASPETTLEEIATIMKRDDVGSVPIVEGDQLCGIITDRDIVIRAIAEGLHPADARAEEILTDDIRTVEADDDVELAAELMSRHQVRRLPVVEGGALIGMVAIGDIAVKNADDRTSGDTLEGVSRGVKSGSKKDSRAPMPARSESTRSSPSGRESRLREQGLREHKSSGSTGRSSAESAATRGRKIDPGKQGITNHPAGEETARNSRVIPFRDEARTSTRKPATKKKAG